MCLYWEREREMFYLTTHSTHFIYGYMASDIWWRTILMVRKETRCRHIGYSYRLTARVLLYAPSHRQDNTYHGLCYTSRGALAGTRNSSMGPPHEGSIRRPIAPWMNALPLSYYPAPCLYWVIYVEICSDRLSRYATLRTAFFVVLHNEWMNEWMNKWMNEWMFNNTPARKTDRLIGCQKKVNAWNGYIIKNWKIL